MKNVVLGMLSFAVMAVGVSFLLNRPGAAVPSPTPTVMATVSKTPTSGATVTATPVGNSFTMAQVAAHNSSASCYTVVNGSVYDLTSQINAHPGGSRAILALCGIDATSSFTAKHGGQSRPESELASVKIGTLAR